MERFEVAGESFVLLPAEWTVAAAAYFVRGLAFTHVIVRLSPLPGGETYLHYLFTELDFRRHLDAAVAAGHDVGRSVEEALGLRERRRRRRTNGTPPTPPAHPPQRWSCATGR